MTQVELISRLLPSIPELSEILTKIRDEYLIEEVLPEHEQLIESLSQERSIEDELRTFFFRESPASEKIIRFFTTGFNKSKKYKHSLREKRLS